MNLTSFLATFLATDAAERVELIRADARGAHEALVALGDECERLSAGAPADAIGSGNAIAECARALGLGSAAARAKRATIAAFAYQGKLDEALAVADEAATEATRAGDAVEAARARVASLHALAKLGHTSDAIVIGTIARDALVAAGRTDLAARAELNIANIHKIRGETRDALAALERALAGIPDTDAMARGVTSNSLGETLFQLDRFDEAEHAFREADRLLVAQPFARAVVAGNLADLLARQGRVGEALRVFDEAARATKDVAPGHHARLEIDRAEALLPIGAFAEALDATDRALAVALEKGLASESVRGLSVRARAYLAAGRRSDAAEANARAEARAREIGDQRAIRAASILASELALAAGEGATALRLAHEAIESASTGTESPLDAAVARTRLARAHLVAGEHHDALRESSNVIETASALAVAPLELDATLVAADAERAIGGVDRSIVRLTRAVAIAESARATLAADRHRAAYAALSVRAYEDLALDLLARGDVPSLERAFETTERARSRTLLEAMLRAIDRAGASASQENAPGNELATLRARLSALHAAGQRPDAAGERRGDAPISTLNAMHETERAIDDVIARLENARGIGALLAAPLDAPAIRDRLGKGDALISYFASGDELLAFTATDGALGCVRAIAPLSEVAALVEKFLYLLREGARRGDPNADARSMYAMSRAIARAVVEPVMRATPQLRHARRLVIVPCGALHALPFALLDLGDGPLVDRHEIQIAPSASIACAPTRAAPRRGSAVVAFADGAAPLIDEEASRVAAILGCVKVSGEGATRDGLRDAVSGASIVHLACHGRFVPSLPAASGLRLADGWLPLRDIVDLRLDADLVFLSGCETGRHAVDAGEELSGLARAFHAAGARRLVTTLWSVRDAAALAIAERFHAALREGNRPSAALRESMLALRHESPHPSWWAPFVVSGVL